MTIREMKTTAPLPAKETSEEQQKQRIVSVRSHVAIQDLGRTDSKRQGVQSFDLHATLYEPSKGRGARITTGQTQIIFKAPETEVKIEASTDIVLTYLLAKIPEEELYGRKTVATATGTLSEYMELRGLKDRKEARRSVKQEVRTLAGISITQSTEEDFVGIPIAGDIYGMDKSGNIVFSFSPTFKTAYLTSNTSYSLDLDKRAFKVNNKRNPHSWYIYKKLLNHYSANMGQANEYRLSVSSLLEYIKTLPTLDEVEKTARGNETARIIAPLERDLEALVALGVLEYWDYCHKNGEPLTDEEQAARFDTSGEEKPLPYAIASTLLLTWKFTYEDNRPARLKAKQAAASRRIEGRDKRESEESKRRKRIERLADKKIAEALAEEELGKMKGIKEE